MGKKLNLIGQKFGRLTVIKETDKRYSDGSIIWECQCECGNRKLLSSTTLRKGKTNSCGCLYRETRKHNLIGQKFGKLIVIEEAGVDKNQRALWNCQCECGNKKIILGNSLVSGTVKSCGCLKKLGHNKKYKINDKIGTLTVLEETQDRKGTDIIWRCKCDCGKEIFCSTKYLSSSLFPSCGHLNESKGSIIITQLLEENHYIFEKEKTFDNCYFIDNSHKARFDFWVNNKYLIEYDGQQHFQEVIHFSNTTLEERQQRDEYKNRWCKENNIPLIRIPYTHLKNITIDDLKLDTSNFIIK